jgi:DNA primase
LHNLELAKRQILDRVDILDLISEHVKLKRSGQRWVGLCPFHSEKTPSFTIRPDHGSFKCFGCGKGGDVFSFVQMRENVDFMESMRILADRVGIELGEPSGGSTAGGPSRFDIAKINAWAAEFFRAQLLDRDRGRLAREYLAGRKVAPDISKRFELGLAPDGGDRLQRAAARLGIEPSVLQAADLVRLSEGGKPYDTFRNRLMFPIRDATGRVVGFGGRTLGDDRAKYINTAQNALFDKGRGLYGIDLARNAATARGRTIVVEGYTDCLAAHQAGFEETVATLGTALTDAQVKLLRRYCEEMVLLFDSDEAGEAAAERAIRVALPLCVTIRLAQIPDGKDPSDFLARASAEAFSDVLNRAVDALEFKWSYVRKRYEGGGSDSRRREAILDFLRVVAEACQTNAVDAIQRGLIVNQVAHLIRTEREEVDRLMRRLAPGRKGKGQPSDAGDPSRASSRLDGEQAAWTRLLEVLLSEPGLIEHVKGIPDVARIRDERDRRIAQIVLDLGKKEEAFSLVDVLARCVAPDDGERVTELAGRGANLGRLESTLQAALEKLVGSVENEEIEKCKEGLLHAETGVDTVEGETDARKTIQNGVKRHRHFAPRRLLRQSIDTED